MEDIPIPVVNEDDEETISLTPEGEETATDVTSETITVIDQNDYEELDNLPQVNGVELKGNKTAAELGFSTVATSGSYNDLSNRPIIPAAQVNSDWDAESGVAQVLNKPTIPNKTSQLQNDSGFINSESDPAFSASPASSISNEDIQTWDNKSDFSGDYGDLTNKPTLATVATSGSYNDLTDKPSITPELVEMSYGESNAWAKFIAAYNAHSIVYCRASSTADPSSGSQTRKAFMAYVNNATNPTQVEFQYYRSVSSHTDAQQGDQVFIYLLTNANGGTWSVTTRNAFTKIVAGTNMSSSYSNGVLTLNCTVADGTEEAY